MAELSRKDYLKRYLGGSKKSEKKKKKAKTKKSSKHSRLKIVDEDIDLKKIEVLSKDDDEVGDEAPFVVDIIDERPEHVKISETYSSTRWKKLGNPLTGDTEDCVIDTSGTYCGMTLKSVMEGKQHKSLTATFPQSEKSLASVDPLKQNIKRGEKSSIPLQRDENQGVQSKSEEHSHMKKTLDSKKPTDSSDDETQVKELYSTDTDLASAGYLKMRELSSALLSERKKGSVKQKNSRNKSPPVRTKYTELSQEMTDSDGDCSPPRGRNGKLSSAVVQKSTESKKLAKTLNEKDRDNSPPRRKTGDISDGNLSPPRSKHNSHHHKKTMGSHESKNFSDVSHDSNKDKLPQRKDVNCTSDITKMDSPKKSASKGQDNLKNDLSSTQERLGSPQKKSRTTVQYNSDNDISPPREKVGSSPDKSRTRVCHNSDSDFSPPRERLESPTKKSRTKVQHNSDSDFSPPREKVGSSHKNGKTKTQHKSASGFSPSQERSRSPKIVKTKAQHSSDSDFSPPRKGLTLSSDEKYDADNVASSKKLQSQHSRNEPPSEQITGKRMKRRHDSDSDSSPSRDSLQNSSRKMDAPYSSHSPVHKGKPSSSTEEKESNKERPTHTLSGMKAGLQDAATLQKESQDLRQRERKAISEMGDELSGRNAEVVSRDKDTGRKRDLKEERLKQKEEEKKNNEKQEKYLEWGKGLKQRDDQQKKLEEDLYEMSKPLARYTNDEDLERELKDQLREGDPMLEYAKKKRQKSQQVASSKSLPVYDGPPAPPNRFNILPGYRWDGVDRSNGFEKKFFEKINSTKAKEHEAYMWSIENM